MLLLNLKATRYSTENSTCLPKEWAEDEERGKEAGVPQEVQFATKPQLAQKMLERALTAEVPCKWVTADEIYGSDRRITSYKQLEEQMTIDGKTRKQRQIAVIDHQLDHLIYDLYSLSAEEREVIDNQVSRSDSPTRP